jgi:hypothetical protein
MAALLATSILAGLESAAQDPAADAAKQKEAAAANMKKADLEKATVVESEHFIVASKLPTDKAKALGTMLDRIVPIARKGARFEPKEEAWKGKLTIYYLPEVRDFKGFIRNVVVMQPNGLHYDLRSDTPYIVDPVEVPGKPSESSNFANTTTIVAGAFLKARGASANLPDWLVKGFGRITFLRSEGLGSKRYQTYKTQAKTLAGGGKAGKPAAVSELWGEGSPENADVLGASFVEYLAYGPGSENFLRLVYGFRPDENGNAPSVAQAFEAAGWKEIPALEKSWQKWATTGK